MKVKPREFKCIECETEFYTYKKICPSCHGALVIKPINKLDGFAIKASGISGVTILGQINKLNYRTKVINDINIERNRQDYKWGVQVHPYAVWYTILGEEFGEVGQAIQQGSFASKDSDADDLYKELIQVAAVASAMAEQMHKEDDYARQDNAY